MTFPLARENEKQRSNLPTVPDPATALDLRDQPRELNLAVVTRTERDNSTLFFVKAAIYIYIFSILPTNLDPKPGVVYVVLHLETSKKPCITKVWFNFGEGHCPFEVRSGFGLRPCGGWNEVLGIVKYIILSNWYLVFYLCNQMARIWVLSHQAPKCDGRRVQCESENTML